MNTMFRSQELWDLVEFGFEDKKDTKDPDQSLRDKHKKDAKALFFIQQALDDIIFSRMHFELLEMKEKESVQEYLSKVSGIVNTMRSYGETITEATVVKKVLLYEDRLGRSSEKVEEKAFQVKGEPSSKGKFSNSGGRGKGRGGFRGRGGFWGRGRRHFGDQCHRKSHILCHYCKKNGNKEVECCKKQREENQANFTEQADEESNLFMAHSALDILLNDVWFIDSGCSNHMCGTKSMFKELDESKKSEVRLENDKPIQVKGRGIVVPRTSLGNVKLLKDVQYVPGLAHNLLSVGQLMISGYSIIFDDKSCSIHERSLAKNVLTLI
ncbi:uncharacterized protein LOC130591431 [Beta vulgaris subsp. vulgaris]|uniref:uncharacterized protein LOC130591431 n=1 Tax=Beta vulgaris subsp. vulgaris TaxID=3555 RepID=UPI00053FE672|nr:uncharacterized protein LOC130591431 [Beta vulgaris subsp. vulgaris]